MMIKRQIFKQAIALAVITTTLSYSTFTVQASNAATVKGTTAVSALQITEFGGDLESAYATWKQVSGAAGYDVYYKKADKPDTSYIQIDSELIREYDTYCRADVVGIAKGDYTIKVVPVINGEESEANATTDTITVNGHVREGFAFSKNSSMGTGSGGYNDDGTVPEDAQILYITKDNINNVTLDVITGKNGQTTTCTGLVDILAKRQKGIDKRHLIIRMEGLIKGSDVTGLNTKNYLQLKGCYNVTFEGIGNDATMSGWSLLVRNARNVEIRNIGVMLFKDDGISLDTDNENIWVHNNDIFYGAPGSDADQVKGDGSCDVKGKSTNVTVSYNHFWDSGKSSLCGMSDSENFYVTYHHNWYDHSDSRHPRIRVGSIHIYNNYFDGNAKYGVGVTKGSSAFVESNVFRNCKYPMLSSLQGSDIATNSKGGFSGEAGGMIKAYNNSISGAKALVYANNNAAQFDAYLASSRNEQVPASYKTVSGSTTYSNFDTDSSIMYSYTPDSTEDVVSNVTTYAGRMNGGDLTFAFDNSVDDESYTINTELKAKLTNYTSSLVKVGGNSLTETETPEATNTPAATYVPVATQTPAATKVPATNAPVSEAPQATATPVIPSETTNPGMLSSTGTYTDVSTYEDSQFANAVYVAANGSATGTGSYAAPYDLETALNKAASLDSAVILLKEGTYSFDHQITIAKENSGTQTGYKVLKACKNAAVTLDFSAQTYNSDTSKNARGLQVNGNYWYIGGLTIYGAADNGMMLSGSHNVIEQCIFNANRDTGLQISRSSSSVTNYADWPSYNQILNCTSKNNCDPASYENADGFAAKLTCGDGNVFDGCISNNNSDDGWDLFAKTATGPIGVVTIKNCIAIRNGVTEDGTTKSSCDGNGFKLGGSGVGTPHIITNCIAIENLHHGFTDNNNPSALNITNCTAFNNNLGGSKNNFSLYRCNDAVVANCVSYTTNKTSDKYMNLTGSYTVLYNSSKWYKVTDSQAIDTSSSTSRGEVLSSGISANDFINAIIPSVGYDFNAGFRNADGTINTNGVAIVASTSTYGTFSTDGGVIGARLNSTDNKTMVSIAVKEDSTVTETPAASATPSAEPTQTPVETETPSEKVSATHNFTENGKTSTFYSITGNLTTKDQVTYEGMTLTTGLKYENGTNVSFTAANSGTLTLVFNNISNKKILIDGNEYTIINGLLTAELDAGNHTITKKDTNEILYFIKFE